MLFSQRKKLTPVKDILQKEGMDDGLRSGLWDALHLCLWEKFSNYSHIGMLSQSNLETLFLRYWHSFFKKPLDTMPRFFEEAHKIIRGYYMNCEWYEVYDFIEFTARNSPDRLASQFVEFCNNVLERELSAYRIVDGKVIEITSDEEIESIESAIKNADKYNAVRAHLEQAIFLMSDRKTPDYRNSIKESISAVESLAKIITNDDKATLGAALNVLEKQLSIHPALKKSLSSLYGYTSDEGGIRHGMLEESNLDFNDAKFMLVSCTAFINYLIGRTN